MDPLDRQIAFVNFINSTFPRIGQFTTSIDEDLFIVETDMVVVKFEMVEQTFKIISMDKKITAPVSTDSLLTMQDNRQEMRKVTDACVKSLAENRELCAAVRNLTTSNNETIRAHAISVGVNNAVSSKIDALVKQQDQMMHELTALRAINRKLTDESQKMAAESKELIVASRELINANRELTAANRELINANRELAETNRELTERAKRRSEKKSRSSKRTKLQ